MDDIDGIDDTPSHPKIFKPDFGLCECYKCAERAKARSIMALVGQFGEKAENEVAIVKMSKDPRSEYTPRNLSKFIKTGEFEKIDIKNQDLDFAPKMIYITGCGRSGTTMVFDIINEQLGKSAFSLDEPRVLYMNENPRFFDIWSKMAFDHFSENVKIGYDYNES